MLGFTFNSVHSGTHKVYITKMDQMFYPGRRHVYEDIPKRDGSIMFPGKLKDRSILLNCVVLWSSKEDLRSQARSIGAWLNTEGKTWLTFDDEPDVAYLATVVDPTGAAEDASTIGEFLLAFRADPYAYSATEIDQSIINSAIVNNAGTEKIDPLLIITINQSVSNLTIQNEATGEELIITGTLAGGTTVEIDAGYQTVKTCKINGANGLARLSGDWITLNPGNNRINVSNGNASLSIKFRAKWL